MTRLFLFSNAVKRDPSVDAWLRTRTPELGAIAEHWFGLMRECGDDVRELMHDGNPTACVGEAAFAYVGVFTSHVNVGFFQGAELPDPHALLIGTGKFMRHVKLSPHNQVNETALAKLIDTAYHDMQRRLAMT